MRKALTVAFGLVLVAGMASASNTGFKLNYELNDIAAGFSGIHLVAVPNFYFPDGNVGNNNQNSIDFCTDLNGAPGQLVPVAAVLDWNRANDQWNEFACTRMLGPFPLQPNVGYGLKKGAGPNPDTIAIVGSHNDDYARNKSGPACHNITAPAPGRSGTAIFSVPYHVMADNSIELCTTLNNGVVGQVEPIAAVLEWQVAGDQWFEFACSRMLGPFTITPGIAYGLKVGPPAAPSDQCVSWEVY